MILRLMREKAAVARTRRRRTKREALKRIFLKGERALSLVISPAPRTIF
jgi:hypothetical protein